MKDVWLFDVLSESKTSEIFLIARSYVKYALNSDTYLTACLYFTSNEEILLLLLLLSFFNNSCMYLIYCNTNPYFKNLDPDTLRIRVLRLLYPKPKLFLCPTVCQRSLVQILLIYYENRTRIFGHAVFRLNYLWLLTLQ